MKTPEVVKIWNLINDNKQIYKIPKYQRLYVWNHRDWSLLWYDITSIRENEYFLGIVLYALEKNDAWGSKNESYLIDGHQRFATLILLKKALILFYNNHTFAFNYDTNTCTFNYPKYGGLKKEKKEWKEALRITSEPNPKSINKYEKVISFFYMKLVENIHNEVGFINLINKLNKLVIVAVNMEIEKDSPQDVFDSLNSKGKTLNNFERINNFVILTSKNLEKNAEDYLIDLWDEIWSSINNSSFGGKFIRIFLFFYKTSHIVSYLTYSIFRDIYAKEFKGEDNESKYIKFISFLKQCLNIYIVIDEIKEEYVKKDIIEEFSKEKKIYELIYHIKSVSKSSILLLLLLLVECKIHKTLKENHLLDILKLLYSFVIRRNICDLGRNENVVFEDICKKLLKKKHDFCKNRIEFPIFFEKVNFSIKKELFIIFKDLSKKEGKRERFPQNKEFKESLITFNFEKRKTILKLMLEWINKNWMQNIMFYNNHIEHIFPRNINKDYQKKASLSDEDLMYLKNNLDNIGNLSILYGPTNSKMSNLPLYEKLEKYSDGNEGLPINYRFIKKLKELYIKEGLDCNKLNFTPKAFRMRQKWLVNEALKIWPIS